MVMDIVEGKKVRHQKGNPLEMLASMLQRHQVSSGTTLVPFIGGAVGYIAYEFGKHTTGLDLAAPDDLGLPELAFNFYRKLLAYDHRDRRWFVAAADFSTSHGPSVRKRLTADIDKMAAMADGTESAAPSAPPKTTADAAIDSGEDDLAVVPESPMVTDGPYPWRSSLTREQYLDAVRAIQERIGRGTSTRRTSRSGFTPRCRRAR
jgi:para-aminobenzoate synthetase component 1